MVAEKGNIQMVTLVFYLSTEFSGASEKEVFSFFLSNSWHSQRSFLFYSRFLLMKEEEEKDKIKVRFSKSIPNPLTNPTTTDCLTHLEDAGSGEISGLSCQSDKPRDQQPPSSPPHPCPTTCSLSLISISQSIDPGIDHYTFRPHSTSTPSSPG